MKLAEEKMFLRVRKVIQDNGSAKTRKCMDEAADISCWQLTKKHWVLEDFH